MSDAKLWNEYVNLEQENIRLKDRLAKAEQEYQDAIKDNRNLRLESELAALKRAAWDVHDDVSAMIDNGEAMEGKAIRKVLNELGELLPARRPADSAPEVTP